jgi:hypothetical protein
LRCVKRTLQVSSINASSTDSNNPYNIVLGAGPNIPGFRDSKATYQSQQAWTHLFIIRATNDSTCSSNFISPNALSLSSGTSSILSMPDEGQPIQVQRPKF